MLAFAPLAFVLAALSLVEASPIAKRDVPISNCTTIATGNLRTTNGQTFQLSGGQLVFGGSLQVEFQSCQPNFGLFDGQNGTPVGGHIYIPSTQQCLTVPTIGTVPFTVGQQPCEFSDDSRQVFTNFVKQSDGKIYYVGGTQADGSYIWHSDVCSSGYFGVSSSATSGAAELACVNDGHIIGLNI